MSQLFTPASNAGLTAVNQFVWEVLGGITVGEVTSRAATCMSPAAVREAASISASLL